ncbi:MAG: 6-phosphofructokinase [Oscillospiraceae bacterium]|nr:6-phosphofructokinase [Oscillospiraceae bacterium]
MKEIKTIGVLTSGGDAPGMNAVIRSVVRTALSNGLNVKGICKGYAGLLAGDAIDMELPCVSGTLQRGGTILGSARSKEFATPEGIEKAKANLIDMGIDALVVCGGDGTFRGAMALSEAGVPCVGIPCTIDHNIGCTDYTIGFDTAVNTVVEIVDKLRDTSQSHNRCSIVEVMGHNCGAIALHAGICCGAEAVIIPEVRNDLERDVLKNMSEALNKGKTHFIIIASEGVTGERAKQRTMDTQQLAAFIEEQTGVETRATVLGHVQRGGKPTARDRRIGSMMGNYAVTLLKSGASNCVVTLKKNRVDHKDIKDALEITKTINYEELRTFNEIR